MWTYSPQKRQARSAFALRYRLLLRSCKLMGVFVISPLPSFFVGVIANSRAPLLHGHYAASLLLRARPPPSRLPPFSWVLQLYGFLASATFVTGRGGLLQLLNMSLSPCYPYHPAGVSCRFGQPAPCHAAFAPRQRARPPDLSFVSRPPMVLLSLWPGDLLPILKDGFRRSASSALLSSADATQAKGLLAFLPL